MKNRQYVISRDRVYVGVVVRAYNISCKCINDDVKDINTKLSVDAWKRFRSILFVPNQERLACDLLYKSPNYPILNMSDNEIVKETEIIIKDVLSLAKLLQYFNYNEQLTYEDIIMIRNRFLTGKFAKDNCNLFGYKETMAEDVTFFNDGVEVTNPKELAMRRAEFRFSQKLGSRSFSGIYESPLPKEYFDLLDDLGDNTFLEIIGGWSKRINAFIPDKEEGQKKN